MLKRCIKSAIILLISLVAFLALRSWLDSGPYYQGKPLRDWLSGYEPPLHPAEYFEINQAIRSMGTNAVPQLLKLLQTKDSSLKLVLIRVANKAFHVNWRPLTAEDSYRESEYAFAALGASASNSVTSLIDIYQKHISEGSQSAIIDASGRIGPTASPAIPLLLNEVRGTNTFLKVDSIYALGRIHSDPNKVVPSLLVILRAPDSRFKILAGMALGNFGAQAQVANPDLIELFNSEINITDKMVIKNALEKIDPYIATFLVP